MVRHSTGDKWPAAAPSCNLSKAACLATTNMRSTTSREVDGAVVTTAFSPEPAPGLAWFTPLSVVLAHNDVHLQCSQKTGTAKIANRHAAEQKHAGLVIAT